MVNLLCPWSCQECVCCWLVALLARGGCKKGRERERRERKVILPSVGAFAAAGGCELTLVRGGVVVVSPVPFVPQWPFHTRAPGRNEEHASQQHPARGKFIAHRTYRSNIYVLVEDILYFCSDFLLTHTYY
jgi:hypothetical protein